MDLLGLTFLGGAAALLAIDLHAQERARLLQQAGPGPRPRPAIEHRCPYCHQVLADGTPRMRCGACATRHHASCWEEHGRCSVHGCAAVAGRRLPPVGEPRVAPTGATPATEGAPVEAAPTGSPAAPVEAAPAAASAQDPGDAAGAAAEPVGTPVEGVATPAAAA